MAALAWPAGFGAWALAPEGAARVGFIDVDTPGAHAAFDRYREACQRLEQGTGRRTEHRFWPVDARENRNAQVLEGVAREVIASRPDLAVATFREAAIALVTLRPTFPLLFHSSQTYRAALADRPRLVGRPNVTGFLSSVPLAVKRLEILRDTVPGLHDVGLLADEESESNDAEGEDDVRAAAGRWDIRVHAVRATSLAVLEAELQRHRRVQAWLVPRIGLGNFADSAMCAAINATGRPAIYALSRHVRKGGLMSYEAAIEDAVETFARQTTAILGGTPVERLPIEVPRRFRFAVNLATARVTGIALPPAVLKRADVVVGVDA